MIHSCWQSGFINLTKFASKASWLAQAAQKMVCTFAWVAVLGLAKHLIAPDDALALVALGKCTVCAHILHQVQDGSPHAKPCNELQPGEHQDLGNAMSCWIAMLTWTLTCMNSAVQHLATLVIVCTGI